MFRWLKVKFFAWLGSKTIIKIDKLSPLQIETVHNLLKSGEYNCALCSDIDDVVGILIALGTRSIWTHFAFYSIDTDKIFHSVSQGTTKATVEEVVSHYNNIYLLNIERPICIDLEESLGVKYDYDLDYEDHTEVNCVEYGKMIFGIEDPKTKNPIDMKKYAMARRKI